MPKHNIDVPAGYHPAKGEVPGVTGTTTSR